MRKNNNFFYGLCIFVFPWIIFLGLIFFGIKYYFYLTHSSAFFIRKLELQGDFKQISKTHLNRILTPLLHQSFFHTNNKDIRALLLSNPWVFSVGIRKIWPDTIILSLKEQKPIARFGANQLMNEKGDLFAPPLTGFPRNLPILVGSLQNRMDIFHWYQAIQQVLLPLKLKVQLVNLEETQSLQFQLDNQIWVMVGSQDIQNRLQRLAQFYSKIVGDHPEKIARIDLRYDQGLAVKAR